MLFLSLVYTVVILPFPAYAVPGKCISKCAHTVDDGASPISGDVTTPAKAPLTLWENVALGLREVRRFYPGAQPLYLNIKIKPHDLEAYMQAQGQDGPTIRFFTIIFDANANTAAPKKGSIISPQWGSWPDSPGFPTLKPKTLNERPIAWEEVKDQMDFLSALETLRRFDADLIRNIDFIRVESSTGNNQLPDDIYFVFFYKRDKSSGESRAVRGFLVGSRSKCYFIVRQDGTREGPVNPATSSNP